MLRVICLQNRSTFFHTHCLISRFCPLILATWIVFMTNWIHELFSFFLNIFFYWTLMTFLLKLRCPGSDNVKTGKDFTYSYNWYLKCNILFPIIIAANNKLIWINPLWIYFFLFLIFILFSVSLQFFFMLS